MSKTSAISGGSDLAIIRCMGDQQQKSERVTVYGADWCGDTIRTLRHLDQRQVPYDYVNIDDDQEGERKVIEFNNGKRRIPLVEIATEKGTKALSVPSAGDIDKAMT